MHGVWIIEIAELDAIGRPRSRGSRRSSPAPPTASARPTGATPIEVPRQCVFAGTRQPRHLSARRDRQPPVLAGPLRHDRHRRARPRPRPALGRGRRPVPRRRDLVARHAGAHRRGQGRAGQALPDRRLGRADRALAVARGAHRRRRLSRLRAADPAVVPRAAPLNDVSVGEVLQEALGIEPARWTRADQMRVSAYLKSKGWERYQGKAESRRDAVREWRYRRPPR